MKGRFFLSHHREEELHRCYAVRGQFLCARCTGLYPTLLLALLFQFAGGVIQSEMYFERWVVLALSLPALLDWVAAQLCPHTFSNPWRTLTGVLMGAALGRMLYIHMKAPFPIGLRWQLAAGVLAVLLGWMLKWARLHFSSPR